MNVDYDQSVPLVMKYVVALKDISRYRNKKYNKVIPILDNLVEGQVQWTPYTVVELPERLKDETRHRLRIGALCYMECWCIICLMLHQTSFRSLREYSWISSLGLQLI